MREEQRYTQIMQGCMDIEIAIDERERNLGKIAEETDTNNHRVMREQRHQKDQKDDIR